MMKSGMAMGIAVAIMFGVGGCASVPPSAGGPDPAHSSRNALDWAGTYRGVLPCADCEGIDTTLTLNSDGRWTSQARYLGKDDKVFSEQGSFTWDERGGSVTLSGTEPARYLVGENRLIRLASDGSRITGALADHYVLTKVEEGMKEKRWKLVELRGKPVPAMEREPYLILRAEDGLVNGYGGCNTFGGSYTIDEATSRIRFGQLAMTLMACSEGMDVEGEFTKILEEADNYSLNGDSMTLNRGRMAPLARFEAVYLQ